MPQGTLNRELVTPRPKVVPIHVATSSTYWGSDVDDEYPPSPASSDSSFDEDEVNRRITPYWPKYRSLFESRGFQLDRVRDVKEFYRHYAEANISDPFLLTTNSLVPFAPNEDEDALCPDAGLPDNLFRGTRISDGQKLVVKAVHLYSREYNVNRVLSCSPLRDDPMNHTIPVLDLIEVEEDEIVFIVMEEWSSQLIIDDGPCCLKLFLAALRQCIEHAVFLHKHNIAHLDISLRNLLSDYEGHYAYIDYEISRRFEIGSSPRLYGYRGTEVPPECEKGEFADPYKIDVWALAVLMLRACKLTGYFVPELMQLIKPMLHERPELRPSTPLVLRAFDSMVASIGESRLRTTSCTTYH
ncbi:kinase-like domain-containing protein [Crucibulum laeve]|uniref:Kinase-like domain-containing protein n=1 Tax=Crucibulum laeve TaxID=68775 RepID=A0A5C3MAR5_9AGAR|nr:kinase-like domain-containing protein [Crucibulum laeve]